jgi:two-component system chemotaxis response regulator CheY
MPIKMYSIGEISKLVKISSDTLRYYDEIQLLNPDYINPSNNYRFYDEEQVKDLLYIMDLKSYGFNLEEIKVIIQLSDEAKIKKLFAKKKAELVKQRGNIDSVIEKIENKLKVMKFMEETDMNEKILVIDDAPFMRMMVKDILTKNGYEVIEAADGKEGIEQFKTHSPALVLIDIVMPSMDGIAAVKEIKKIDKGAKIVMLSALGQPAYIADSLISGAVDFIVKPFQADRLALTAAKHLAENTELDIEKITQWRDECKEPEMTISQSEIDKVISSAVK